MKDVNNVNNKLPKYCSKYYIRKEIEHIAYKICIINYEFNLFKELTTGENKKYICDRFPETFSHTIDALFLKLLIELAKLFDNDDDSICIPAFLNKYKKHKNIYNEKEYIYIKKINSNKKHRFYLQPKRINACINELEKDIKNNESIIKYLKTRRNKSLVHNDKKFEFNRNKKFSKSPITYEQLEKFIEILFNDINQIYMSLFGTQVKYLNDYISEIKYLKDLIKKDFETKTVNIY